jgi:signal transduction histidine kinase/CheY-like chemotaxis protein
MAKDNNSSGKDDNRIMLFRILTSFLLITVAVVGGCMLYFLLTSAENDAIETSIDNYRFQLLTAVESNLMGIKRSNTAMSSVYQEACLTDSDWPNCYLELDYLTDVSINIYPGIGAAFGVFVTPDEVSDFEDMYYAKYEDNYNLGVSAFGKGIYGYSDTLGGEDFKYRIVNGSFGVPILAPITQTTNFHIFAKFLALYDEYSEIIRFTAINEMFECSRAGQKYCSILSQIITYPVFEELESPGLVEAPPKSIVFTSMKPKFSNSTEARGYVLSAITWSNLMGGIVPASVPGVQIVLTINEYDYLFEIIESLAVFITRSHSSDSSHGGVSLDMFDGSTKYYLRVENSEDFNDHYKTKAPIQATIIFTAMIVALSAVFYSYDHFVNKQILQKGIILETKQHFVRYISHEIRTPINTIHIGINLILDELRTILKEGDLSVPVKEKLQHWHEVVFAVSDSSVSAIQVLNDILDYEQIQISKLNMDLSVFSPWQVFEEVYESFKYNFEAKGIGGCMSTVHIAEGNAAMRSISASAAVAEGACSASPAADAAADAAAPSADPKGQFVVNGDKKKIQQVVRNFMSNAIKFTNVDGQISLEMSWIPEIPADKKHKCHSNCNAKDGYAELRISNTGVGLSKDQVEKLFSEGVQFDANRLQDGKGSGLGLWITKGIVEEHKGIVYAESKGLGQGATFGVILPLIYDTKFEIVPKETKRASIVSKISRGPTVQNILVVDDSVATIKLLKRLLTNAGFTCNVAYDGAECLEKLKTDDYYNVCDLVVIDNHMPKMTGPEAVCKMRELGYTMPVAGLTGSVTKDELDGFKVMGCDFMLSKPLQIPEFQELINSIEKTKNFGNTPQDTDLVIIPAPSPTNIL